MKNYILIKLIIVIVMTSSITALAEDRAGGGGATIKDKSGELKTLPEADLVFTRAAEMVSGQYPDYYKITNEVQAEVKSILVKLPKPSANRTFSEDYAGLVLSTRDTFLIQKNIDQNEYNQIKADYTSVIASYNKQLDEAAFVLTAISKNEKTYILPEFDLLSTRRKALVLIHEYFMRETQKRLSDKDRLGLVLQLDVQIYSYLKIGGSTEQAMGLFEALSKLVSDDSVEARVNSFRIKLLEEKLQRPVLLSELVVNPYDVTDEQPIKSTNRKIDPSLAKSFNSKVPFFAEKMEYNSVEAKKIGFSFMKVPSSIYDKAFWDKGNWKFNDIGEIGNKLCLQFFPLLKEANMSRDGIIHYHSDQLILIQCSETGIAAAWVLNFTLDKAAKRAQCGSKFYDINRKIYELSVRLTRLTDSGLNLPKGTDGLDEVDRIQNQIRQLLEQRKPSLNCN